MSSSSLALLAAYCDGGVIWLTSDASVAIIASPDRYEAARPGQGTHEAIVEPVGLGTAEIMVTSFFDPDFEARAVVVVTDAGDPGVERVPFDPDAATAAKD